MPRNNGAPILTVLKKYERDPDRNHKKAVLLTPQGGYFLYGNRFCSVLDYELELISDSSQIQGCTVQKALFSALCRTAFKRLGRKSVRRNRSA